MTPNWYCRINGHDHGPYTAEQLAGFTRERRLSPLDFVREGDGGAWLPVSQVPWLKFTPIAPPAPPMTRVPTSALARSREMPAIAPWVLVGMAGVAAVCVAGVVILVVAAAAGHGQGEAGAPQVFNAEETNVAPVARLCISGRDATGELQSFIASLPDEQKALLGLMALATGDDIYAAEITLVNAGGLAVRVYPQNLTIQYGNDSTSVATFSHPRFLQTCVLQPGEYAQGLVMYQARIDIGAAMRLSGGKLAYTDPTIEVEYGQ
jgi:hypothetical protein